MPKKVRVFEKVFQVNMIYFHTVQNICFDLLFYLNDPRIFHPFVYSSSDELLLIEVVNSSLFLKIFGRNLLWYGAVFGAITAICRAAVSDELLVVDPHGTMSLVCRHTHFMPKRWRAKENSEFVRMAFETLFQVCLFLHNLIVLASKL